MHNNNDNYNSDFSSQGEERQYFLKQARQLAQSFEEMLQNSHNGVFFEQNSFKDIVEYYEDILDFNKALEAVNYALTQYPYSAIFYLKKASLLIENQHYTEALALLEKAQVLSPNDIDIWLVQAEIYLCMANYTEAEEMLHKSFAYADNDTKLDIHIYLSEIAEGQGKPLQAYDHAFEAIELDNTNPTALERFEFCSIIASKASVGIPYLQKILDQHPFLLTAWNSLGNLYMSQENYTQAIQCYDYSVAIDHKFEPALVNLGHAYYSLEKYDSAITFFEEALQLNPTDEEVYLYSGLCFFELELYEKALTQYEKALQINTQYPEALFEVAECYRMLENDEQALYYYQRAIELVPDNTEFLSQLADFYCQIEQYELSQTLFETCVQHLPHESAYYVGVARAQFMQQQYPQACYTYEQAIELLNLQHYLPEKEEILSSYYCLYATALYKCDKKQESMLFLSQALAADYQLHELFLELVPQAATNLQVATLLEMYKKS